MTEAGDSRVTALQRGGGLAAWRQIADALADEIRGGTLAAGAQLPAESALAARFGVNRHTVRRALGVLAEGGLVRTTQGRGSFVEQGPIAYPIGPRTRFSEIVSRTGREAWGDLIAAATNPADADWAEALGIAPGAPILELLTVHRADGAPISTARTCLPLPRFTGFDAAYAASGSLTRAYAGFGVADYTRLSTRIGARPASPEEAERLDIAPGRTLIALSSVNVDGAGTRIQATRSLFAADRVELVVE
ncbi:MULTISPECIES: phosphonate metabolism transcriptional regulator PhnF [unclassified Methylobacterium]|uniref:phosphonate metabolism transcriptional regulator PhnF n=1 Tax=unclassified Methylobacterium TaxID=2615210 RepID=UPI000700E6B7|nr:MULTISPECIES: phosphonate metabolism transcriptional regulator PhnF [unclassified Methylobacterium]KQO62608.1 phosphonate metabolism transcriptional regulator PhnF [Methylobacterium sp. Leaf88]KQO72395.1 phosphonate metabolism transcriptional regulator PhnF [Methylobacterium sp. Leaf89]KQT82298.1 phosphonate metabolism transcriptional regulator PhnF [Methylobacterium sp. Leaf465]